MGSNRRSHRRLFRGVDGVSERTARILLIAILIAFVFVGITYSVVVPPFEAPDEWSHLSLVRYFVTHKASPPRVLPERRASTGPDMAWFLTYHDPPLYYAPPLYHGLCGLLVFWADMDDLPSRLTPSPSWEKGWVPEPDGTPRNKNIYVHRPDETWDQSSTVRVTHVLRVASLMMGAVTVLCAYALTHLLWPERPFLALGAAAFVAFNPKFISISASVTNDNLLNMLFGLSLVCMLRCIRDGAAWHRWALLGGLVGVGLLTKQSALLLLPIGLLAAAWQRSSGWRKMVVDGTAFLLAALAVGGWWYGRNAFLYGDPLGMEPHFASQVPLAHFGLAEAWKAARSYWAAFGWAPILIEPWMYAVVGGMMLAALAGIAVAAWPGGSLWHAPAERKRGLALLAFSLALNGVGFVRWALATGAPTGRLLFPTLPAVGVLCAWGLAQWARWRVARWALLAVVALAVTLAALVPWCYLHPAYASPYLPDGVPDTAETVGLTFQGGVELAGYAPIPENPKPGQKVQLTLYWRASEASDQVCRVWVQLGPQDPTQRVAEDSDWLGGTLYPNNLWRAGDTIQQVYWLTIPEWSPAPSLYWIRLGLLDDAGDRIRLADLDSDMVVLGPWRLQPSELPAMPPQAADYRLGMDIYLVGYEIQPARADGEHLLHVDLHWVADAVPEVDYTVYAHLVDGEGNLVGQHDGPPRDGEYPTSWWLSEQIVVDRHTIDLSELSVDTVWLQVGIYDPTTMERLPVYDESGQRLAGDGIPLAEIDLRE